MSSLPKRHNKIEDFVGDVKQVRTNNNDNYDTKQYLKTPAPSSKIDNDILMNYQWGHGRFSRPNEHFTSGPPLLPHLPRSETHRPSTAPNPSVQLNRNASKGRIIHSSHSSKRTHLTGKANFLKKANMLKRQSHSRNKSLGNGFQRTRFDFVRDQQTKFPIRITTKSKSLNATRKPGHRPQTKHDTSLDKVEGEYNVTDETGIPTGKTKLSAMENVSAALQIIDKWTTQSKEEESGFKSFSLFARVHLAETLKSTRSYGIPNIPRSACCIELLLKMGQLFGRYSDLHEVLMREVLRTVYYKFDEMLIGSKESLSSITAKMLMDTTPYFHKVNGLESKLFVAEMKANRYSDMFHSTEATAGKNARVMDRAISSWSAKLIRVMFLNWASTVSKTKHSLRMLKRRRLQILFRKWKSLRKNRERKRLIETISSLQIERDRWETAATEHISKNEKLVAENEMLKKKLASALDADAQSKAAEKAFEEMVNKMKKKLHIYQDAVAGLVEECLSANEYKLNYEFDGLPLWMQYNDLRPILVSQIDDDENNAVEKDEGNNDGEKLQANQIDVNNKAFNKRVLNNMFQDPKDESFIIENGIKYANHDSIEKIKVWINHHIKFDHELYKQKVDNLSSSLKDSKEMTTILSAILDPVGATKRVYDPKKKIRSSSYIEEDDVGKKDEAEKKESKLENGDIIHNGEFVFEEGELEIPEDEIPWAGDMYYYRVMHELDDHDRARLMLKGARNLLELPNSLLEPEEVSLHQDANWNFAFLSCIYATTPGLSHGGEALQDVETKTFDLRAEWNEMYGKLKENQDSVNVEDVKILANQIANIHKRCRDRIHGMEIGHLLWNKSLISLLKFAFGELSNRARGGIGTVGQAEELKEKSEYTRLNKHKIRDILVHHGTQEEQDAELRKLQAYLSDIFVDLRKIYKAYAAMGAGGGSTISVREFNKLIQDSKVLDANGFNQTDVDLIFVRVNWEMDEEGNKIDSKDNPDRAMTSGEFVEGLIRVAYQKFGAGGNLANQVYECMRKLINKHILPFAKRSDAEAFRKVLASKNVQRVFKKHGQGLKKIFAKRAGLDKSMSMMEYSKLLRDTKTIDGKSFSHKNLVEIFNNVQDESCGENEMMESELDYAEFIESIAAVGAYKYPDPYTDISQRIEKFILMYILADPKKAKLPRR
jgi:hypothetical protein